MTGIASPQLPYQNVGSSAMVRIRHTSVHGFLSIIIIVALLQQLAIEI